MRDLRWLVHRVRTMTPKEAAKHAYRFARNRAWARRRDWVAPRADVARLDRTPWPAPAADPSRARELLGRRISVFGLPPEQPFEWRRDARSGLVSPRAFGPTLDYRDAARVGSAKNAWEKGRMHHWPVLALAARGPGGERFGEELVQQARSWVADSPFPLGIHWSSALEAGMRLLSWVWTERLLRGTPAHETLFGEAGLLWNEAYWHQWSLARMVSGGSSANNHVIGESVGLYLAARAWPVFRESAAWGDRARAIACDAALRQFLPSGLNAEMGFSYHVYSAELLLLAMAEMDRQGEPAPEAAWSRMAKAVAMLDALRDAGGNLPTYGDSDDAFTLWVEPDGTPRTAFLEDLGARLFGWPAAEETVGGRVAAHGAGRHPHPRPAREEGSFAVRDGGVFVLASRRGTPREVFVLADAGPLGYGRMMAHGHSDALAFTLSVAGHPVLVDPGTGDYHGDARTRTYLRGVRAHNTVSLDGQDQAVSRGLFLWHHPFRCHVDRWEPGPDGGRLEAWHDGYRRLPGKPTHRRALALSGTRVDVEDRLEGGGEHDVEVRYHFHPDCQVRLAPRGAAASGPWGSLDLGLDPALQWSLHRGDDVGGWHSPRFGATVPATTLVGRVRARLPFITTARLEVQHAG